MDRIKFAFPTAYFGNIAYFQAVFKAQELIIEQFETYPKQTFRNRMQILTSNGVLNLSIPVIKSKGSKSKTAEIYIDHSQNWQMNHWRAITSAYAHAPFFEHYERDLQPLIFNKTESLVDFNLKILMEIDRLLSLNIKIEKGNEFLNNLEIDKKFSELEKYEPYKQVFIDSRAEHIENLSILDALLNLGPMARNLL